MGKLQLCKLLIGVRFPGPPLILMRSCWLLLSAKKSLQVRFLCGWPRLVIQQRLVLRIFFIRCVDDGYFNHMG